MREHTKSRPPNEPSNRQTHKANKHKRQHYLKLKEQKIWTNKTNETANQPTKKTNHQKPTNEKPTNKEEDQVNKQTTNEHGRENNQEKQEEQYHEVIWTS